MTQASVLNDLLQIISDRGRALVDWRRPRRPSGRALGELADLLLSSPGEASGVARARELLDGYRALDYAGRTSFFRLLVEKYGADRERLGAACARFMEEPGEKTAKALHTASEPRRLELFRRLNFAPGGTADLVAMRLDLLERLKDHPEFWTLNDDFKSLFQTWFNRGFLILRRIDWQTSAAVLEKIIKYEAVHAIRDWDDLRGRIDLPDRRLYAFFHPRLGDDPLIFVEVALTTEIPGAIAPILETDRQPISLKEATTAVFYSISNCQKGLQGISFGNFLIKQVVEDLQRELRDLKTFVTLSPVPGFADWLAEERAKKRSTIIPKEMRPALKRLDTDGWWQDEAAREDLAKVLPTLAAWYLTKARDERGRLLDPVARFHLGNGARLERINPAADLSPKALRTAHGVMVNYLYVLSDIEKNHEGFVNDRAVAASSGVKKLARSLPEPKELVADDV
ncbi:malonyl-CoA decarboxylase [Amorphus orientalis]|uniref:Malonyl-CoA decarboxylase n=1 Tax=Amorphus orientalis TaxID=649198 RepID=A0AAE3VNP1_9HYPH|nr:malonyl-CoA decarboxylase [Amorphus orientalis]MDQ0315243.1 malonyl-CoA decarboxylase [Amorphus orientalis]